MDPLRFSDGWLFSQTQSVEQNKLVRAAYVHQSTGNVLLHYMYQRSLQRARWKAFTVIYIYITGMVLDTTRMGGENKNPRKHCRHRSFEEKKEKNSTTKALESQFGMQAQLYMCAECQAFYLWHWTKTVSAALPQNQQLLKYALYCWHPNVPHFLSFIAMRFILHKLD